MAKSDSRVNTKSAESTDISDRLEELRRHLNLRQEEFCVTAGINYNTYKGWVSRGTAVPTAAVAAVAQAFGVRYEWLMLGQGDMLAGQPASVAGPRGEASEPVDVAEELVRLLQENRRLREALEDLPREYAELAPEDRRVAAGYIRELARSRREGLQAPGSRASGATQ